MAAQTITLDQVTLSQMQITRDNGEDAVLMATYALHDAAGTVVRQKTIPVPLNATRQAQLNQVWDLVRPFLLQREGL